MAKEKVVKFELNKNLIKKLAFKRVDNGDYVGALDFLLPLVKGENAPEIMSPSTVGIRRQPYAITAMHIMAYKMLIKGTILEDALNIPLLPPIITIKQRIAIAKQIVSALKPRTDSTQSARASLWIAPPRTKEQIRQRIAKMIPRGLGAR